MGSLNTQSMLSVSFGKGTAEFGVFLYQESLFGPMGNDLNNDGDAADLVPRWFSLP